MNITINLAVVLLPIAGFILYAAYRHSKETKTTMDDEIYFLSGFLSLTLFAISLFALCCNINFKLTNLIRIECESESTPTISQVYEEISK